MGETLLLTLLGEVLPDLSTAGPYLDIFEVIVFRFVLSIVAILRFEFAH
jgi:hypothetical protein